LTPLIKEQLEENCIIKLLRQQDKIQGRNLGKKIPHRGEKRQEHLRGQERAWTLEK
jgi:hypothetical protein